MKRTLLTLLFAFFLFKSFSQTTQPLDTYLKFSGGRVAFGTSDYFGYSLAFDLSKSIVRKPAWGLDKLLLGGELIFENGAKNPIIQHATIEQYLSKTFYQTSNVTLWTKASYYPLKKVVKGFNIQLGPTVGYSYRSREAAINISVDASGNATRQSYLAFDNSFTVGYRISTGIEFDITKKIQTGIRLDWSNNNKGEINTLMGLKAGVRL